MRDRLEAAFEYAMDHPEALMLLGGMFFAFLSIFAVLDTPTTSFIRLLGVGLIACGVLLYVLRLGLQVIIRIFRKLFHIKITFDNSTPPPKVKP